MSRIERLAYLGNIVGRYQIAMTLDRQHVIHDDHSCDTNELAPSLDVLITDPTPYESLRKL